MKTQTIERLNRNSKSVEFINWLLRQPHHEFRIAKQTDMHFIIHPLNKDGETFDLKWDSEIEGYNLINEVEM